MYLLNTADYVEMDTKYPVVFRLSEDALGLKNWGATLYDIDSGTTTVVQDVESVEVAPYVAVAKLDGYHPAGTSKFKLDDVGQIATGNTIRIANSIFNILSVESEDNLITVDRRLSADLNPTDDDPVTILHATIPSLIGVYKISALATEIGRFILTINNSDNSGLVNPIDNVIEVVPTLDSTVGQNGRLNPISNGSIT